ncbi:MAG: C-GCAxxG-C-C family protein [Duncaniella sp.]|uniref:C-GCAxxG-C-C family protein n=1 Tax=Duncaniella sp. TaxID=2518496 RepID=UPI0023CC9B9B|nr:C-GCAxxG-C-C family protein [Duncaniella sp.]MDE6090336.1 C-GCAxxG-C-C family protein [Duncaniella sp.]
MKYTLEQRKELARELRKQGKNCSQCVALAFDDVIDADPILLERLASGFGSGFGGQGEVCGAISGATMVCGLVYDGLDRPALYSKVRQPMDDFRKANGSYICRELKQPGRRPCIDLITDGVEMLHRQLEADGF